MIGPAALVSKPYLDVDKGVVQFVLGSDCWLNHFTQWFGRTNYLVPNHYSSEGLNERY